MGKQRRHGTGHLYKRGATWWLAYHVGGKLVRESARTSVKKEAEALLRSRLVGVDTGTVTPETAKATLADLERIVLDDLKANGRRSTRNVRAGFKHLRDHFGADHKARVITTAAVKAYTAQRLESGAAVATVNRECAYLRRGFRLAMRYGLLAARPEFSLLRENNIRRGFLDPEQFEALVKHLPEWLAAVAGFAYVTGWRKTEMFSLQWSSVDRKRRVIRIETSKNDEPRTMPYGGMPELAAVIRRQWARHEELLSGGVICPYVFQKAGRRIHDFAPAWKAACRAAGVPGRLLHDFRRTAVRNFERAGVARSVAMNITGHKTESVYKRYAIVSERDVAEGLAKLHSASVDR